MSRYIYRLEKFHFYYYDYEDGEDVEDCCVLGYFSSKKEVEKAIAVCERNGISQNDLRTIRFEFCYTNRQEYVYELSYGYSILNQKNRYIDYSYVFPPQNTDDDCKRMKNELIKTEKFKPMPNKIFDDEMPDGFWVEKLKLNKLYGVIL